MLDTLGLGSARADPLHQNFIDLPIEIVATPPQATVELDLQRAVAWLQRKIHVQAQALCDPSRMPN
jgi:hypothetical protein